MQKMPNYEIPSDRERTGMVIPVSEETFFNTGWKQKTKPPCPYDMLYHPPDYNPKAKRADRQEPDIIRKNIWNQEVHKPIASTTHMNYGRPYWPIIDKTDKLHNLMQVKNQNPHMRVYSVLEWAVLLYDGKQTICE